MKRLLLSCLTLILTLLCLSACGGSKKKSPPADGKSTAELSKTEITGESSAEADSADESRGDAADKYVIHKDATGGSFVGGVVDEPPADVPEGYVRDDANFRYLGDQRLTLTSYTGKAKNLIIPAQIDGKPVAFIRLSCFFGCAHLENVYIEDGIVEIQPEAFQRCVHLKHIRLPRTISRISGSTFAECFALQEIYIPDNVNFIAYGAFTDCRELKKVRLPADAVIDSCFENCRQLSGAVVIPGTGYDVNGLYANCPLITSVRITEGSKRLTPSAFEGMSGIEEVHIPDSIADIKDVDRLFADSPKLQHIYVVDGSYAAYALAGSRWDGLLCSEPED